MQHEVKEEIVEEGKVIDTEARPVWEKLLDKAEDLQEKVVRHFEDKNDENGVKPSIIKSSQQFTADEWEKHQTIHTPYVSWCHHCNAARDVRREHQRTKPRANLLKDVDADQSGPMKISMEYMYLHDGKRPVQRGTLESTTHGCD